MRPTVGRIAHYVSHGTPIRADGTQAFTSQCRAAVISEVGAWVTVETTKPESYSKSEGRPIRHLEQWFFDDAVGLVVLNPTGEFFHSAGDGGCRYDGGSDTAAWSCDSKNHAGGTWHWPARVEEQG